MIKLQWKKYDFYFFFFFSDEILIRIAVTNGGKRISGAKKEAFKELLLNFCCLKQR